MEHLDIVIPLIVMIALLLTLLVWDPIIRWKFKRQMRLRDRASRKTAQLADQDDETLQALSMRGSASDPGTSVKGPRRPKRSPGAT
jgi:hypothetical protein